MLWTDRAGRFSALKTVTLLLCFIPAVLIAVAWVTDDLGAKPLTEALHRLGLWSVRFLLITLAVSPARRILNWPKLVNVRRMLGVTTALYALAHFALYVVQQQGNVFTVASEIVLRFYLTIGFVALLGLVVLAWTSTDYWVKRLGARAWNNLHTAVYAITTLALVHFALQLKLNVTEAVLMAGLFIWLMTYRLLGKLRVPVNLLTLAGLSVTAALTAAVTEATWYAVRNGISFITVLNVNLRFSSIATLRPAWWVLAAGLLVTLLHGLRKLLPGNTARGRPARVRPQANARAIVAGENSSRGN